tara:strand:- start:978 stop:1286 length:309 start_codon:yes stop_codon:yes gene_type:complete
MKQILSLIIISIVFAAFALQSDEFRKLTQLVVIVPELNSSEIQKNLEIEFARLNGVVKCETSLMTKTLMINYDSHKVTQKEIENIFNKWECSPNEFSYKQLH